jgi:hypothetical protein
MSLRKLNEELTRLQETLAAARIDLEATERETQQMAHDLEVIRASLPKPAGTVAPARPTGAEERSG